MALLRSTTGDDDARASTAPLPLQSLRAERLRIESFDYLRTRRSPQLLGLAVRTPFALPEGVRPELVVERATRSHVFTLERASISNVRDDGSGAWLWRGVFAVPTDITLDPSSLFTVRMLDQLALALPTPSDRRSPQSATTGTSLRAWPYAVRRGVLVVIVAFQLGVMPGPLAGGALADGRTGADASVETTEPPTANPQPVETEAEAQPEEPAAPQPPSESPPQPPSESPPKPPSEPSPVTETEPKESSAPTQAKPGSTPPAQASAGAAEATGSGQTSAGSHAQNDVTAAASDGSTNSNPSRFPRAKREQSSGPLVRPSPRHASRQPAVARKEHSAHNAPSVTALPSTEFSAAPIFEGLPASLTSIQANEPPAYLVPIYKAAGRRYHVPWRVLAAINQIETDYGQNLSVSSAGALGWMQFMPATWQEWGVDADRDGRANPYSPQDAIFTAARYLDASGASRDLAGAVFAYNHADWYVTEVLVRARMLGNTGSFAPIERGYSLPLDPRYMQQLGRTDDGVDIETPPDGALVYSITPGVVSAVASDPAGFGPNYPVIEATAGSLSGQYIYYGHVAQALVQPGAHVAAGQPIAIVGHTGDAASLGHGHIEIGFSDAGGAPLDQHGSEAWTPAGSAMRAFLVDLSAAFGVDNS